MTTQTNKHYLYDETILEHIETTRSGRSESINAATDMCVSSNASQGSSKSSKLSRHRSESPSDSLESIIPRRIGRELPDFRLHHLARKQSRDLKEKAAEEAKETAQLKQKETISRTRKSGTASMPPITSDFRLKLSPLDEKPSPNPVSPSGSKTPFKELGGGFFRTWRKPSASTEIKPQDSTVLLSTDLEPQTTEEMLHGTIKPKFLDQLYVDRPLFTLDEGKLPQRPMIPPASKPIPIPNPSKANMKISSFKRHSYDSSDSPDEGATRSGRNESHRPSALELHAYFANDPSISQARLKRPKLFPSGSLSSWFGGKKPLAPSNLGASSKHCIRTRLHVQSNDTYSGIHELPYASSEHQIILLQEPFEELESVEFPGLYFPTSNSNINSPIAIPVDKSVSSSTSVLMMPEQIATSTAPLSNTISPLASPQSKPLLLLSGQRHSPALSEPSLTEDYPSRGLLSTSISDSAVITLKTLANMRRYRGRSRGYFDESLTPDDSESGDPFLSALEGRGGSSPGHGGGTPPLPGFDTHRSVSAGVTLDAAGVMHNYTSVPDTKLEGSYRKRRMSTGRGRLDDEMDNFVSVFGEIEVWSPEATVRERDVPEHLANSPLCPRHPKHPSRGTGYCPVHG
jgi:hypothetical protein